MARVGGKNTAPELVVRKLLHAMGFRFRLHRRNLPGTPDIVFPGRRKIIFVHGCFWHAHGCKIGKPPKSNKDFWNCKLERNRSKDRENEAALLACGWDVLTVWQCEIRDQDALKTRIRDFIEGERMQNSDRQAPSV